MQENLKHPLERPVINAFSIDVEGFIESNLQSFIIPQKYINQARENNEIEKNVDILLGLLCEVKVKATFFLIGRLAQDIPQTVRSIAQEGHEIGCHNYAHVRVFDVERDEFKRKLSSAKCSLEDIAGRRVYGFRAPDFSITKLSIWALDVLNETGFVYDSSIYPFGLHDVYGIKDANAFIHKYPSGLIEFPLATTELLGHRLPFGGGGYFRLYPLWLTKHFIARLNRRNIPCMSYIHPYEVGPVIPRISEISGYRNFRHYYHCKNGDKRVRKLLAAFKFAPAIDVLRQMNLFKE